MIAPNGAAGVGFGSGVAVDGDTALVGADADDTGAGLEAGSAFVFVRSGQLWMLQAELEAPDGADFDAFGRAVAVDADTALAGAHSHDLPIGTNAGSAYAFIRSDAAWTLQAALRPRL